MVFGNMGWVIVVLYYYYFDWDFGEIVLVVGFCDGVFWLVSFDWCCMG